MLSSSAVPMVGAERGEPAAGVLLHRSHRAPQRPGDIGLGEVGEEPQHEYLTLTLRERVSALGGGRSAARTVRGCGRARRRSSGARPRDDACARCRWPGSRPPARPTPRRSPGSCASARRPGPAPPGRRPRPRCGVRAAGRRRRRRDRRGRRRRLRRRGRSRSARRRTRSSVAPSPPTAGRRSSSATATFTIRRGSPGG